MTNSGRLGSKMLLSTALIAIAGAVILSAGDAVSRVPFVRDCVGKDVGDWAFGEAADGCDAGRFGSVSRIKYIYSDFVFDRGQASNPEHRKDYVTNVNALIRDLATQYIRSRNPDVKDDEMNAFIEGVRAVAHQETFWSHYRVAAKGGHKLSTGDRNISHGMMQINQRYHASRETDRSFDLVGNVGFGIEHFYTEWEGAWKARCIYRSKKQSREQTLENVTRAAYSSYNGGPGAVCRWTNPKHTWAKNDINYFKKLKGREWSEWIRAEDKKLDLNLDCVRSGDDLCAVAKERRGEFLGSRPLLMEDGSTCVTVDGTSLKCATDARVFTCLAGLSSEVASAKPLKIKSTDRDIVRMTKTFYEDRLALCRSSFPDVASIGDVVTTQVSIAVKNEIGGKTLGFAKKGQSFQVLDLEVDLDEKGERYYHVRLPNKVEGWISGGDSTTAEKVAKVEHTGFATPAKTVSQVLPTQGARVAVVKTGGLKFLAAPEKSGAITKVKATLEKGAVMSVEGVEVSGAANEIWLRVRSGDDVGYVYAGRTFPKVTVDEWLKVL